jgi:hypothetical protein
MPRYKTLKQSEIVDGMGYRESDLLKMPVNKLINFIDEISWKDLSVVRKWVKWFKSKDSPCVVTRKFSTHIHTTAYSLWKLDERTEEDMELEREEIRQRNKARKEEKAKA